MAPAKKRQIARERENKRGRETAQTDARYDIFLAKDELHFTLRHFYALASNGFKKFHLAFILTSQPY